MGKKMNKNKLQLITIFMLILTFSSCNKETQKAASLSAGTGSCSSGSDAIGAGPLFKLNGQVFTRDGLPTATKEAVYNNEYAAYSKNLAIFEEYALRLFLAKNKGLLKDPTNPPQLKELLTLKDPSNAEAKKVFNENKHRMPPNSKFEHMKPQIVSYLKSQQVGLAFRKEVDKMKNSGAFTALQTAPLAPEIKFSLKGFPQKGNKNAKIKIIEVSDYLCGHCQKAHPKVLELLKKYGDKVSFTQVNFSLRPEGLSGTYIRGAYCAQKQSDKLFWKFHDKTFEKTSVPHDHSAAGHKHTDGDGSSADSLKKVDEVAKASGLNMAKFNKCLGSKEAHSFVTTTNALMTENGINSTPAFIFNNKKVQKGVFELEKLIKSNL